MKHIVFAALLFCLLLSGCGNQPSVPSQHSLPATPGSTTSATQNPSNRAAEDEQQFKTNATRIQYQDLARNPDRHKGENVYLMGHVAQVQENKNDVTLLVETTKDEYGMWDGDIWVNYTKKEGEDRILENDIVQIWGTVKGLKSYTTVLGSDASVPEIDAKYITIGGANQGSGPQAQPSAQPATPVPAGSNVKADGEVFDEVVHNYEDLLVSAINLGEFSLVEPMLLKGSSLYDSQKKLVESLSQNGTTEELVSYEIKNTQVDDKTNTVYLTVGEVIKVKKKDSESTNEYTWVYTVKQNDQGMFQFSDIRKP